VAIFMGEGLLDGSFYRRQVGLAIPSRQKKNRPTAVAVDRFGYVRSL